MEYLFLITFVWLVLSGIVAAIAASRGRSGRGFFFLSFLISPLLAGILALLSGPGGKKCPRCAETVKVDAQVCRFCGAQLFAPPPTSGGMKCSRCGETVKADAQVCRFCGAQFVATDTQFQAMVPPVPATQQPLYAAGAQIAELVQVRPEVPIEPPDGRPVSQTLQNAALAPPQMAPSVATSTPKKPTATVILYVALFAVPIALGTLHTAVLGPPGARVFSLLLVSATLVAYFEKSKDYAGKGPLDIWQVFRYKHKAVAIGALVASLLIECLALVTGITYKSGVHRLESALAAPESCQLVDAWAKLDENAKGIASDAQSDRIAEATQTCKTRRDTAAKALADAEASRKEVQYTEHCRDVVAHLSAGRFDAADEKVVESAPPKPDIYLGDAEGKDLAQRIATKDLQAADLNRTVLPCGDTARSAFAHAAIASANAWEALRNGQVATSLLSMLTSSLPLSTDSAAALGRAAEGLAIDTLKTGATQSEASISLCSIEFRLLKAVSPSCQRLAQVLTAKHNAAVAQAKAREAQVKAKEAQCDALQKARDACGKRCDEIMFNGQDERSLACDDACDARYKSKSCEDNSSESVPVPSELPDVISLLMRSPILNVAQPVVQGSGPANTGTTVNQTVQSHTPTSAQTATTQSASASTARKECVHQCIGSCNDDPACERNCVATKCH